VFQVNEAARDATATGSVSNLSDLGSLEFADIFKAAYRDVCIGC
jgi:hypothetical protein